MKILKTIMLSSVLLIATNSSLYGGVFSADDAFLTLTWSPSTSDGEIDGNQFDGAGMIGFTIGKKSLISEKIGAYFGGDFSYNKVDENDNSSQIVYSYKIVNLGLTFTPIDSLTLMGGIGYSTENAKFVSQGDFYESDKKNSQKNFNATIMYDISDGLGVALSYNTASSSIGYGLSINF